LEIALRNISKPYRGDYLKHVLIVAGATVPILLIFIFAFVVPFGSEFKEKKREKKIVEKELRRAKLHYDSRISKLRELEIIHREVLKDIKHPKDMDLFLEERPFIKYSVPQKDLDGEEGYLERLVYKVQTKALYTTLESFYDILENDSSLGFRFQLDFPIQFEANSKNRISALFNINLYKLKPIKKEIVRPYQDIQK
jgi:hypothetical protein